MKKTYNFEKRQGNKTITVRIELELSQDNKFSVVGYIKDGLKNYGGQCQDEIKQLFGDENETVNTILDMWDKYHLNDMHPGTEAQEKALNEAGYKNWANEYSKCCEYLDSVGLLIDNGYKFGCGWLKRDIPSQDLEIIKGLLM